MFLEIQNLEYSSNKFTESGLEVSGQIEKLYINLYRRILHRHFGSQFIFKLPERKLDFSIYTKFHLLPLLLDSGLKAQDIFKFLQIDEKKVKLALKSYEMKNMWFASNIHMGALAAVSLLKDNKLKREAEGLIRDLDDDCFTSTKWKYKGSINRIAAFYHYVPFIDKWGIEISLRMKKLLLSDLYRLQNRLGSFCSPNGFSCMELDSVVVAAYLKKLGFDTEEILKRKLFNHLSNFENGWPLYGFSHGYYKQIRDILFGRAFTQDKLWNLKKILLDVHKPQYDNGHRELVSKANDKTLMSNYFGLVTYIQIIQALKLEEKTNLSVFDSYGLSYVIK